MKGFGNLIKNELIKTGKSVYFRVFVILILVLSIVIPVDVFVNYKITSKYNAITYEYWYDDDDGATAGEKALRECYREADKFFKDNSIDKNDWRYQDYYEAYGNFYCARVKVFDMLAKGEILYADAEGYFYEALVGYNSYNDSSFYESSLNYDNLNAITPGIINENGEETYDGLTKEEYEKLRDEAQKNKDIMSNYIKTADIQTKYTKLIAGYNESLTEIKKDIEETEAIYKKTNSPTDKQRLKELQVTSEKYATMLWGYQALKSGNYDADSWQYNAVTNDLSGATTMLVNNIKYDKDVYEKSDEMQYYKSYKCYCLSLDANINTANKAIAAIKYSLENNIPIAEEKNNSSYEQLAGQMKFISVFICLFMIVMAGTTLSNEFISGAIRLLLIRPRSRSKILLSKILMVFIYGSSLMLISLIIMSILNFGLCETKDLFTKTVMVNTFGKAYAAIPILLMLFKCVLSLFSINFMISFSILLSVLFAKGGVLAVALSNMIQVADVCLTELFFEVNMALNGLLAYTPVPYLDLSMYITSPIDGVGSYYYSAPMQNVFNPIVGAVIIAVFSAVMYAIAFIVFRKKQIKS